MLSQLDDLLFKSTKLRGVTSFGDHHKLKKALGINTKHLVRHWKQAGAPRQIPGYATHIRQISRAGKYLTAGGALAIVLGGISTRLEIDEVCNANPNSTACEKVKFTALGKLGGSVVTSFYGGGVGGYVAGQICLAFAAATAGTGGVACLIVGAIGTGVGAYFGGEYGGKAGEYIGEEIYEVKSK